MDGLMEISQLETKKGVSYLPSKNFNAPAVPSGLSSLINLKSTDPIRHWFPNSFERSIIKSLLLNKGVFKTILSAPDLNNFFTSSTFLMPPPAAIGIKHSLVNSFICSENKFWSALFLETFNTINSSMEQDILKKL